MFLENPDVTIAQLMKKIPGPDFPTAGFIYGNAGIKDAYKTGRGLLTLRAKADIETDERTERERIIVTEIPYQVNKAQADRKDRRAGPGQDGSKASRTCATNPTARACASSSN